METLVAKLVARIRDAEAAGRTWELTDLAGRRALRVRRDEGVETTFLSDEEEAALREMLVEGPPTLDVEGLPRCTWDARRGAFLAAVDGVGTWPRAASCQYFHDRFEGKIPQGDQSAIVPAPPDARR